MLLPFPAISYKRYKDDTSTFVKWLAETAQSCRSETIGSTPTTESAKEGGARLKGKARKLAKEKARTANNKTSAAKPDNDEIPAAKPENHVVDTSELLGLAHTISNSKNSSIIVPTEIIRAGIRAVSARRKCTAYFESITNKDDDEKLSRNESHAYFTKLMEDVLVILQPHFAPSTTPKDSTKQPSGSLLQDLQNRFARLEVEEPEEPDDEKEVEAPVDNHLTIYELRATNEKAAVEEQAFAYFCLFGELDKVRSHLEAVWTDYKLERTDIITAAVVTNTAFQLARRAQDEALSAFPGGENYAQVKPMLNQVTGKVNMDEETENWTFYFAYETLTNFCAISEPYAVPLIDKTLPGGYNPLDNRSQMFPREKRNEDSVLLMELLPEFCYVIDDEVEHFAGDELTQAIKEMNETKKIAIWLAFAATVFLDIHHIMREKVERAFDDFQAIVINTKLAMKRHTEFMRNDPWPKSWSENEKIIPQIFMAEMENYMLQDRALPMKMCCYRKAGTPTTTEEYERFYFHKRQPILCGLQAFYTMLMLKRIGRKCCDSFGTAVFPAQLYNALQQKTNPVSFWPAMEDLINLHTPERIFLGARPQTIDSCFKQIHLMFGHSVTDFAANQRQTGRRTVASKDRVKHLEDITNTCMFFRQAFCQGMPAAILVQKIEEFLNKQAQEKAQKQKPKSKTLRHEWSRYGRLSSTQLLEALTASLAFELPGLRFSYFDLHRQSVEMLRKVRSEVKEDLAQVLGPKYLEDDRGLPLICLWILNLACRGERFAECIGLRGAKSVLLEQTGKVFEDFLDEYCGQKAFKQAD
ncbi:Ank-repeat mbp1 protein [Rutstroemia sp. NJR-2017a WRK4]|nr:Ank-repeat mbp1 protein [Rutstroemia sp. NJR-2017a WRK4]